jgi:hypothetical protein
MRRVSASLVVLVAITVAGLAAGGIASSTAASGQLKAGAAVVDASWHVGASAGQYASDGTFIGDDASFNPTAESVRRAASYGIQSRLQARALVVEGPDGNKVAIVKNDLYIPQDLLYRRTAQILEQGNSGITRANLTMAVTHDHSSPYYSSTAWGAWAFQDVFDVRFYEYYAERMALAVEHANANLAPARVGAAVTQFDKTHRHSYGPAIADDGTPAGYPNSDADHNMTVVRFDDVSDPANPKAIANLVNYSLHGEMLEGNDLISADWVGPLQRDVDRASGAVTVYTQNAVGTAEPERSSYHNMHERLEFTHKDYAQAEYGASLMAKAILNTSKNIEQDTPEDADKYVPFQTQSQVAMEDRWFPGPISHPYPGVSSCRSDKVFAGDPQFPIVGLPDCENGDGVLRSIADVFGLPDPPPLPRSPVDPGLSTDDFQSRGIPLPENYSAPSYTGLEEDVSIHLQAFRLGDILFTVCSCEQWKDQAYNIKTRTDRIVGNEYLGYDWSKQCTQNADTTWNCPNPGDTSQNLPPISDHNYQRMKAQVNNPADGWNDLANAATAESEPTDTTQIKGNYTHSELPPSQGYALTVPISMANDYNGYIASYREYQRGDHYRKALTGWGPHSSDYMATHLVEMGGHLNGGPDLAAEPGQEKTIADQANNDARAQVLGEIGTADVAAYEATLPDDGGIAEIINEPSDIERFSAAFLQWTGGSNFTDNPNVKVQHDVNGEWVDFADQSGEIPVTLTYPGGTDVPGYLQGGQRWTWTAHFEAFASNYDVGMPGHQLATPPGTYRFVVDGERREGGARRPYHLESDSFQVKPWSGITASDVQIDSGGRISFAVGPKRSIQVNDGGPAVTAEIGPIDYPDSYSSPARFIRNQRTAYRDPASPADPQEIEWYCFTCTFRPWADTGDVAIAYVTIAEPNGKLYRMKAKPRGDRWYVSRRLRPREAAYVRAADVRDDYGNFNGQDSAKLYGSAGPPPW